jgi:hypothetical protein
VTPPELVRQAFTAGLGLGLVGGVVLGTLFAMWIITVSRGGPSD